MPLTKVGPKFQVTIPKEAREAAGIKIGDLVEAEAKGETILLRPKVAVDKAFKVYLDRRLAEGLKDIKRGKVSPAFSSAKAAIKYLHRQAKKFKSPS